MTPDQLFRPFRNDHRRVLARLQVLEQSILGGRRRSKLGRDAERQLQDAVVALARQFSTHMRDEEEILYPALADSFPESIAGLGPLRIEHHELRGMLVRLAALLQQAAAPARDEQVMVQVRDLVDLLRIHIHKEEAAVFGVAARVLTPPEVRALADRIASRQAPASNPRPKKARTKGRNA